VEAVGIEDVRKIETEVNFLRELLATSLSEGDREAIEREIDELERLLPVSSCS
jgi:hypothetical protein